jgi:hypothetical protein
MLASSSDRLTASSTRICSGGKNLRQALELKTGRQERKTNKGLAGGTTCEREELTSKTKQVAVNSSGEKQNLWENSQREQKALSGNVETAVKSRETESEREEKTKSKNRRRETARRAQAAGIWPCVTCCSEKLQRKTDSGKPKSELTAGENSESRRHLRPDLSRPAPGEQEKPTRHDSRNQVPENSLRETQRPKTAATMRSTKQERNQDEPHHAEPKTIGEIKADSAA